MTGPDVRIWNGPWDVDGLATSAVRAAAGAAGRLAAARGSEARIEVSPQLIGPAFAAIEHLRIDGTAPEVWAPLSGFFEATDGFVRLHGNFAHHAAAIRRALPGVRDKNSAASAIGRQGAQEVTEGILDCGGIATVVRTEAEWLDHPHHLATTGEPWISTAASGAGAGAGLDSGPRGLGAEGRARGPLAGLRVLDLTRVIAGPTCSQLLGCLGAEVLRLDPPHRPEDLAAFLSTGMGKLSAELDLRKDAPVLHERLIPQADVILLGYRPGSLDRFGLAPGDLSARHPRLVIGDLSAWGDSGPWGDRAGFDSIVQAATGIAAVCGDGRRPGSLPVQALDHATGFRLAAAVMDLLAEGRGGVVRASLLGAARELLGRPCRDAGAADVAGPGDAPSAGGELDGDMSSFLQLDSPHGRIRTVPVPLLVDGAPLSGAIGRYGAAEIRWSPTS